MKYRNVSSKNILSDKELFFLLCLFVTLVLGIVFFSISAVSYAGVSGNTDSAPDKISSLSGTVKNEKSKSPETHLPKQKFVYFNGFIVHLKDNYKKDRVLISDVVLELDGKGDFPEDMTRLRKIIYETCKDLEKNPYPLLEAKRRIKRQIKSNVNNFIGGETVKKVYITKFILY